MFRKILVQLDPSRPLHQAPRFALTMAERFDAELVALYVVDEKVSMAMGGDLVRTMDAALGAVGQAALEDYAERVGTRVPFETTIGYGDTADTIAKYVSRHGVDLVVTGGFHASVYTRIPFGSVVNEIIRKTPASVFLYRDSQPDPIRPGPVVIPYDGSLAARRTIHIAAEFAKELEQNLDVVYVYGGQLRSSAQKVLGDVDELAPRLGVEVQTHAVKRGALRRPSTAVLKHARSAEAPFIALPRTAQKRTWAGLNPLVEHMVVHTDRPILVTHS